MPGEASRREIGLIRGDDPRGLLALHERILLGDPAAREELVSSLFPGLCRRCFVAFRHLDRHVVNDIVEDVMLRYLANPRRFDASRGVPLGYFLYLIAWRRLANQLRRAAARQKRHAAYVAFAVSHASPTGSRVLGERPDTLRWILTAVPDRRERRAVVRWLSGDSVTSIARALGVHHLSPGEQAHEVKRLKDRVRRRLQRARSSL